jgi:hypothetical protein
VSELHDQGGGLDYDEWPAVGVDRTDRVLVAWAENPAATPDVVSQVYLAVSQAGAFTTELIDGDANLHAHSKPAMTVTTESTHLVWRSASGLMLMVITFAEPAE